MKYIQIFIIFILFSSCSENNDFVPSDIKVQLLKKKTYVDPSSPANYTETVYQYDAMNRITTINRSNSFLNKNKTYTYNGDTTKIHIYVNSILDAYYIEYPTYQSHITRREQYGCTRLNPNVPYDSITYLGYQLLIHSTTSCEKIERIEYYHSNNINQTRYETFDNTDDNGSYTLKRYDNTGFLGSSTYTKNDKVASYNKKSEYLCFERAISEVKSWDENNVLNYNSSVTYQYDSNNYPISATTINHINGSIGEYQYEYY